MDLSEFPKQLELKRFVMNSLESYEFVDTDRKIALKIIHYLGHPWYILVAKGEKVVTLKEKDGVLAFESFKEVKKYLENRGFRVKIA